MVPIKHTVAFKDGPMLLTQTILGDIDKILNDGVNSSIDILEDDEDAINK